MSAFQTDKIEHVKTWINTWHAGGTFPAMMLGVYNQNGITVYRIRVLVRLHSSSQLALS